jgi:3-phenylpropionate/trans-cinnamate dioxygenase ferredoxin component
MGEIEYYEIAQVEDLPVGERLFLEVDGKPIVVFNIGGEYYGMSDVCSHDGGPVGDGDLEGYAVVCPRHGAKFDVRTGKVLTAPAVIDVQSYPVRVVDGKIEIGL